MDKPELNQSNFPIHHFIINMKTIRLSLIFLAFGALLWTSCETSTEPYIEEPTLEVVANAGSDQAVELGEIIYLDGSGSKNTHNKEMTYKWALLEKPQESDVVLTDTDHQKMPFTPDVRGAYTFSLNVRALDRTATDQVTITVIGEEEPMTMLISDHITVDRVLEDVFPEDPARVDYIVTQDIDVEALLEIRPQVRIGFESGVKMTIKPNGALKAASLLASEPIIFQGKEGAKGFWQGIVIESSSENNLLRGAVIQDAGKAPLNTALYILDNGFIKMTSNTIHHNAGTGISFGAKGLFGDFIANTFEDNAEGPLKIPARLVSGLSIHNSFGDGNIQVIEGSIKDGTEHIWPKFDVAYDILEDLIISESSRWVLSNGTRINMADDKMIRIVNGASMIALGEQGLPVMIEGITKAKGSWRGIFVGNSAQASSQISYAEIRHAGSAPMAGKEANSIQVGRKGKVSIQHSIIDSGRGNGLEAISDESELEFERNTISNHDGHPIVVATDLVEFLDYHTAFDNIGKPEVKIEGNKPIAKSAETIWKGFFDQRPYLIDGIGKDLRVYSGLRIEAGVTLKFMPNALMLVQDAQGYQAYLKIAGSNQLPVTIKGKEEIAGSWYGITISSDNANNLIDHAVILHGGKPMQNNFSANISIDNAPVGKLTISNSTIGKSGQHGIAIAKQLRTNLIHTNLTFLDNTATDIHVWGN